MATEQGDLHGHVSTTADGNALITRPVHAPAVVVWAVLADGWMYATWVVGASRTAGWTRDGRTPGAGSPLLRRVGAVIDDHTEVLTLGPRP
jgi:uncharacterized protein YndB with AHSA1/START domain